MSILSVANRLNNSNMDSLVRPYLEKTVSKRRILLLFALVIYVLFIERVSKSPVLLQEANAVTPVLAVLFVLSIVWAALIRKTALKDNELSNAMGSILDFIGIWALLYFAWNIMLILVPVIISVVITTGARYSQKYFYTAIGVSILVVLGGAPAGYWNTRPVFAVMAVALLVALPLTVFKLLQTLRIISEIAVDASETQARFMSTVSHELRTPLNSVIAGSGLLYDAPLNDKQREILDLVEQNGRHLLNMVNDLLDHAAESNLEAPIMFKAFSMVQILDEAKSMVAMRAMEKRIVLNLESTLENDVVISDRTLVCQVLVNLIGNAVKYSENDTTVDVRVSRPDAKSVRICVADQGVGIPDDKKDAVFNLFVRVGNNRLQEGSGFGLNLVKTNNARLGGTIRVMDNIGKGTVFEWTVPMQDGLSIGKNQSAMSIKDLMEQHRHHIMPLKCLVVDDNLSNCLIMAELLSQAGHDTRYVLSGEECLEVVRNHVVDLVILDINLGSMSGWDVLSEMQVMSPERKPKVIISSAAVEQNSHDQAVDSGAIEFLAKPVDIWTLISLLEKIFLGNHSSLSVNFGRGHTPLAMISESGDAALLEKYFLSLKEDLVNEKKFFQHADRRDVHELGSRAHYLKNVMNNLDRFNDAKACQEFRDRVMKGEIVSNGDMEEMVDMINKATMFINMSMLNNVLVAPGLD